MKPTQPTSRRAPRGLVAASLDPMAWALLLAGVFDGISDNWVHAAVLIAAALAVGREAWNGGTGPSARQSVPLLRPAAMDRIDRRARRWLTVAAVTATVGYAAAAGGFERYTWPDTVAILVPASVVLAVGWRGQLRPRPAPQPVGVRSVRLWSAVLVVAGTWELAALLLQPSLQHGSWAHPTLSYLMDSLLATYSGRTLTLLAWLALGWWLLWQLPGTSPREQADDLA
jgi:hypothetical protein